MCRDTLGQLDCKIFMEQSDEITKFLHVDTNLWKLNVDWNLLGWAWSKKLVNKKRCVHSIHGTQNCLYLKKELVELTDFLLFDTNSLKLNVTLIIFGWSWSKKQAWLFRSVISKICCISSVNQSFFVCWYKFRKAYFNKLF